MLEKEIEILTEDVDETIEFIKNKCDDETLLWMSEVFEEIIEKTQSKELLQTLLERSNKVVDEDDRKEILQEVVYAEGHLNNVWKTKAYVIKKLSWSTFEVFSRKKT